MLTDQHFTNIFLEPLVGVPNLSSPISWISLPFFINTFHVRFLYWNIPFKEVRQNISTAKFPPIRLGWNEVTTFYRYENRCDIADINFKIIPWMKLFRFDGESRIFLLILIDNKCGLVQIMTKRRMGNMRHKQRVLTPGHQGWNDLHSLCRIGME